MPAGGTAGLPAEARGEARRRSPHPRGGTETVRGGSEGPPSSSEEREGPGHRRPGPAAGGSRPRHRVVPPRHGGGRVLLDRDPEEGREGGPRAGRDVRGRPRRRPPDGPRRQQDPDVLGDGVRGPARRPDAPPKQGSASDHYFHVTKDRAINATHWAQVDTITYGSRPAAYTGIIVANDHKVMTLPERRRRANTRSPAVNDVGIFRAFLAYTNTRRTVRAMFRTAPATEAHMITPMVGSTTLPPA